MEKKYRSQTGPTPLFLTQSKLKFIKSYLKNEIEGENKSQLKMKTWNG